MSSLPHPPHLASSEEPVHRAWHGGTSGSVEVPAPKSGVVNRDFRGLPGGGEILEGRPLLVSRKRPFFFTQQMFQFPVRMSGERDRTRKNTRNIQEPPTANDATEGYFVLIRRLTQGLSQVATCNYMTIHLLFYDGQ